jgi:poly(3-hydroxybutyrate) depolymerase
MLPIRLRYAGAATLLVSLFSACRTGSDTATRAVGSSLTAPRAAYIVHVPPADKYPGQRPLLIALHGYGGSADDADGYFDLARLSAQEGVITVAPSGHKDPTGARFWNAVDTCCDFFDTQTDDVAYLKGLVKELAQKHPVDARHVYAMGLSNGGAMAMRLGCDAADTFAAIVSVAGPFATQAGTCKPSRPLGVRLLHGTHDRVVPYGGGALAVPAGPKAGLQLPPARAVAQHWAQANGCTFPGTKAPRHIDVEANIPGPETLAEEADACAAGGALEFLTIEGAAHIPMANNLAGESYAFLRRFSR